MKKARIAICDPDHIYRGRLHGYLHAHIRLPVTIEEYSDHTQVMLRAEADALSLLILSGEAALEKPQGCENILVLTDEGEDREVTESGVRICYRSRYRPAGEIVSRILEFLAEDTSLSIRMEQAGNRHTKVIGYYSPIKRCMQTSSALCTGQILAENARTMYLSFSPFAGEDLAGKDGDLSDLMYYYDCAREQLPIWIERIKQRVGRLEYIPPASSYLQTEGMQARDYIGLIRAISEETDVKYLLLDLTETVTGLFDVLSVCDEVYTITGHDMRDKEKIEAYRRWLAMHGEEELLEKTRFVRLPKGCPLPQSRRALPGGMLATYLWQNDMIPAGGKE
ncbi:MAG: hypothetical protein IJQ12_10330 [Lachnospiraceae bacterium]|nr:hypothetical protein [Lachnospiraceae bacterium]